MIKIPNKKIYNAYLIETYNYESVKKSIIDFAVSLGFDKHLIDSGTHPDIVFIESNDKTIPLKEIRDKLIATVNFTPKISDRKFYIIHDAKDIMEASENAMLKTLEEPPEFVSIFLVTSNANTLLDTIKSRCQIIKDTESFDYKNILSIDYLDDAILALSNMKYESAGDKVNFTERVVKEDGNLNRLIKIYRILLRDILVYKMTLSKEKIYLREKEDEIISISSSFTLEELGKLVDKLDRLSLENNYDVNKKIATFNFLT